MTTTLNPFLKFMPNLSFETFLSAKAFGSPEEVIFQVELKDRDHFLLESKTAWKSGARLLSC